MTKPSPNPSAGSGGSGCTGRAERGGRGYNRIESNAYRKAFARISRFGRSTSWWGQLETKVPNPQQSIYPASGESAPVAL